MSESSPAAPKRPKAGLMSGVAWMMAFRLFDRAAGFISIMVLARILLPEHFGVVALASGVVAFIELLASMGLDTILIQRRDIERDHYDTAWTIQLAIATICALLLCAVAYPASVFFHEPRLEHVAYVLALGLFFDGLVNIRIVNFRRDMRFDLEFRFMATRRVVALVITIAAALLLENEWALAIGTVSSRATGAVMSYVMIREWPRLTLARRTELLGHSSWLFLGNVVYFVRQRAAEFTIGRMVGATGVGAYLLASELANTLSQELVSPINRVALADLAAQDTPQGVARRFDLLTGQLGLILTPLCFGLSACSDLVVDILFGAKWAASVDVLRILALGGWVVGISSNIGVGFLSLGLYRVNAALHAIGAGTLIPLLVVGTYFDGTRGAALAVLMANVVTVLAALVVSWRTTQYGLLAFCKRIGRPFLASAIMYGLIYWLGPKLPPEWPTTVRLMCEVAAGGVTYLGTVALFFAFSRDPDAAERVTLKLFSQLLARFRRSPA